MRELQSKVAKGMVEAKQRFSSGEMSVFEIAGSAQSYEWGAIGDASKVAQFAKPLPGFKFDDQKPYAEVRTSPSCLKQLLKRSARKSYGWALTRLCHPNCCPPAKV